MNKLFKGLVSGIRSLRGPLLWCVRKSPIISGMPDLKISHHGEAFRETIVTIVLATIPIWLGAFIAALIDNSRTSDEQVSLWSFLIQKFTLTTESGVLIIYAASLIAPVLYMALSDREDGSARSKFPAQISHVMAVLTISIISAGYYTASITVENLNAELVRVTSVLLFAFAIIVLYVASGYKNFAKNYSHSETVNAGSKDFGMGLRKYMEGQ